MTLFETFFGPPRRVVLTSFFDTCLASILSRFASMFATFFCSQVVSSELPRFNLAVACCCRLPFVAPCCSLLPLVVLCCSLLPLVAAYCRLSPALSPEIAQSCSDSCSQLFVAARVPLLPLVAAQLFAGASLASGGVSRNCPETSVASAAQPRERREANAY